MPKLAVFNNISLDGYITDANNDMSWAGHSQDPEWLEFITSNTHGNSSMIFGRKTYEMMASFWPTPDAQKMMPEVARYMNEMPKIVFSKTLKAATWSNTTLFKDNMLDEVRKLKKAPGPDFIIFGSGEIVSQLSQAKLIDEYKTSINYWPILRSRPDETFKSSRSQALLNKTKITKFCGDWGQIVVHPVALGGGRSMFEGMKDKLSLKLVKSRIFKNGNVFLRYEAF